MPTRPRLHPATLDRLRRALDGDEAALRFAAAVVEQVVRAAHGAHDQRAREEHRAAERVLGLVGAAHAGAAAGRLAGDPVLLAAFFQNVDLLHGAPSALGDSVAALVMAALERVHHAAPPEEP